ncbi:unnamed protein product [Effrenium voratum]|nr:unnamed protein product [Effrenium voratum]
MEHMMNIWTWIMFVFCETQSCPKRLKSAFDLTSKLFRLMASWDECEYEGEVESEDSERAITQMDPLELRFSQRKMRNVFADGKLIADSVNQVRPVRRTLEEQNIYGAPWRLEAPFPAIEVLRFRCKLRDETTGRPLLDPVTKKEMFEEESWFTLDNRRLYCLQRVAVDLLPERCTVDTVAEIRKERRLREIRKFRTLDGGRSINVGSVVDGVPFETWSWEEARSEDRQKSKGHKGKEGKEGKEGKDAKSGSKGKSGKGGKGKDKGRNEKGKGKGEISYKGWWPWQDWYGYWDGRGGHNTYGAYGAYDAYGYKGRGK